MSKPLISVVIPAYNCAEYISRSIESALSQDVEKEIIVIDDCSSDSTPEIIQQYCGIDGFIFYKNETNLGAAETRNKAVKLASGQYIAFLDGDDFWSEDKLKLQLEAITKSGCVLCCTARELVSPKGESLKHFIPVKECITYKELLKHNQISCSSVLIKREVALEFPMHHEDSHEDYIMWLEVLQKYKSACGINLPLLKYRLSNTGKSGGKLKSAAMTFKAYRYMGFGMIKSLLCFASYALNGVKKYLFKGRQK